MTLHSKIPAIIKASEIGSEVAVRKAEINIERRAKDHSRFVTGNMRRGWQSRILNRLEGVVYNLVYYTIYNEYGTVNMDAQPMLTPAIEETREEFKRDMKLAWHGKMYFRTPTPEGEDEGEWITRNV